MLLTIASNPTKLPFKSKHAGNKFSENARGSLSLSNAMSFSQEGELKFA